jgi:uncharacterized tellurite resistance protein B-like protein
MHVLLAVLGVLALVALLWLRLRKTGERGFRRRSERSPYAAIDDAPTAGAAILVMVAHARGTLSVACEIAAQRTMRTMMGIAEPKERYIFAKWVAEQTVDTDDALRTLAAVMARTLDATERGRFLRETRRIAEIDGPLTAEQIEALDRLGRRLGVGVDA